MDKNFWRATAMMIGTIIGVGLFAIPYAASRAGFFVVVFYLLVIAIIQAVLHLSYGEICLRTIEQGRLVSFAKIYLGNFAKKVATVSLVFGFYGGQIAYILLGGLFLSNMLTSLIGGGVLLYQLLFFFLGAFIIWRGLRVVAKIEFLMSVFLVLIMLLIFLAALPNINNANYFTFDPSQIFFPYGIILFSLAGGAAVSEMIRILDGSIGKLKKIILLGTFIPALMYLLFVFAVIGLTGQNTQEEPISGLVPYLGTSITLIGSVFGFLACFTSYVMFGEYLKKTFQLDYNLSRFMSWFMSIVVPLVGFWGIGLTNFISVIGVVGAIMGGIDGILILLILRRAKRFSQREPEYSISLPRVYDFLIIALLILGALYQFYYW